jgi:hypothetical protein
LVLAEVVHADHVAVLVEGEGGLVVLQLLLFLLFDFVLLLGLLGNQCLKLRFVVVFLSEFANFSCGFLLGFVEFLYFFLFLLVELLQLGQLVFLGR